MTQLTASTCIQSEAMTRSRFIGLSAMYLLNAMTINSGDLSDIPLGYKTYARKNAKKVIQDAIKFGLTIEKPYVIKDIGNGKKGMFALLPTGICFIM